MRPISQTMTNQTQSQHITLRSPNVSNQTKHFHKKIPFIKLHANLIFTVQIIKRQRWLCKQMISRVWHCHIQSVISCYFCLVGGGSEHSVQGTLSLFDLLLQSLLHGLVLSLPQHVLHVFDGSPVARSIVKHSDSLVATAHQEASVNVKPKVRDLHAVDAVHLLLQLSAGSIVHGHVAAIADGHHPAVWRQGHPAAFRRAAGNGFQEVGILLLFVLHVRVP